jgi:hypothetical protein
MRLMVMTVAFPFAPRKAGMRAAAAGFRARMHGAAEL